ncbi:MAG: GntR family transcriptional regulator [Raoultibacter sp.]
MTLKNSTSDVQITIDENNGIPIWLQLRNRLTYLILSGSFQPNEKLPTVREMAVELGINYNTVGKVYQGLERDNYIVSLRGRGTFVADKIPASGGEAPVTGLEYLADDFIRQCRELGMPRKDILALVEHRLKESGFLS